MGKILAAVLPAPNEELKLQEFEEPELEMDSALIDVVLSEVCGTDVHLKAGRLSGVPYPIIPGHVATGRIRKLRGKMTDIEGNNFQEGDVLTFLDVHRTCNFCWYCCVAKVPTRCPQRKVYGVTYGVEDGLAGGWAQSLYLKPNTLCLRLDDIDPERFMAGGCSLPTALHAIELAHINFGDNVLVLGSGPVGLSAVIASNMRGANRVFCIGGPLDRTRVAQRVGAHEALDVTTHSPEECLHWILDLTRGRGADVTIEATGDPAAVVQAMRYTRDGGRVVIVGQYTDKGNTSFNPHLDLNKKHLQIHGCWGTDFSHMFQAVQMMSNPVQAIQWSAVPLQRYPLSQVNAALSDVAHGCSHKALIDPWIQTS